MYLLSDIINVLEEIAPPMLAEKWDNIGLMIGTKKQQVTGVLCALDINQEVINEAIQKNVECIVTHHPFIFKPLYNIDFDTPRGKLIKQLICHNISVYAMHTNYDISKGGINDILCDKLNISNTKVLHISHKENLYKIATYVPQTSCEHIRDMIINQDICDIGHYKGCTFTAQGEGTFIPMQGSNPYIGSAGQLEKVAENKIECIAYERNINTLLEAIKVIHPYEEAVIDVFSLSNNQQLSGIGRYGVLEQEVPLENFIETLKQVFKLPYVRVTDITNPMIKRIAVCSGSGGEYIKRASEVADVYVTGDIKFHEAQEAKALGLSVIDIGHYASENLSMEYIAAQLNDTLKGLCARASTVDGETIHIK